MRILITCPPMLGMQSQFLPLLTEFGVEAHCPNVIQTLSEEELVAMLPDFDGWIIGDDPATRRVFEAGRRGRLRAAVRWGIGVDNVDFDACASLDIPIENTPGMFGSEVADVALGYLIGLARETFFIDREIRGGKWPKPRGISIAGRTVGLVGYGDIGRNAAVRFRAIGLHVVAYDPGKTSIADEGVELMSWPSGISKCDFIVFTCALNRSNYHMLNKDVLGHTKKGVRIINVARGPLLDESALWDGLGSGHVHSAALDVFEVEPLRSDSYIRRHDRCILGSHNASNTEDAVARTNIRAIEKLMKFLGRSRS